MIICELQRKLATWAESDPARRMDRILRLIAQREWLEEAARITLSSSGAKTPGVDGVTKHSLESESLLDYLQHIREDLLSGNYQPAPARRIYIPKAKGKQRPIGIPCLRDRIVQRAMLMAIEPIWESDFHSLSFGFRPERSVHHAIRAVKLQLTDGNYTKGRWVIEGDLASYFDTVHHRLLMKAVRKRISDKRFLSLLWSFIKVGHVDKGLFCAASRGVPQGGVLSPILSNIMLNEFDQYLERNYLCKKARQDRWYNNYSIKVGRRTAVEQDWAWKPSVAYCRYADDFVIVVKGSKVQAEQLRAECREVLERDLKLSLNMEKTHVTHIDDGFTFLGHRIIRKPAQRGGMRVVTTIPREKSRNFTASLTALLSTSHSVSAVDMIRKVNAKLVGWAGFYQYVDNRAVVFHKIDSVVFWKLAKWLARKYSCSIKSLLIRSFRAPDSDVAKTWIRYDTVNGERRGAVLERLSGRPKGTFRWRTPSSNPYLRVDERITLTSRYRDVATAMSRA